MDKRMLVIGGLIVALLAMIIVVASGRSASQTAPPASSVAETQPTPVASVAASTSASPAYEPLDPTVTPPAEAPVAPAKLQTSFDAPLDKSVAELAWTQLWSKKGSGRYKSKLIELPYESNVTDGDVADPDYLDKAVPKVRIVYKMTGGGNNAIWICDSDGDPRELAVNEIGKTSGTREYLRSELTKSAILRIQSSGSWTVTVNVFN